MFSKANKSAETFAPDGSLEEARRSGVPSIISPDLKIVGDLESSGDIQVDGRIEGDITSRTLTIGEGAMVHGALVAENVRIYGTVTGEVKATSVTLAKTAKVQGGIAHRSLEMEAGASLVGQLSHLDQGKGRDEGKIPVMKPDQDSHVGKPGSATYRPGGNGRAAPVSRHS
ncbi:MAG: polymer-forming cytoskeletal protein [Kiloniellaceae bacterium]